MTNKVASVAAATVAASEPPFPDGRPPPSAGTGAGVGGLGSPGRRVSGSISPLPGAARSSVAGAVVSAPVQFAAGGLAASGAASRGSSPSRTSRGGTASSTGLGGGLTGTTPLPGVTPRRPVSPGGSARGPVAGLGLAQSTSMHTNQIVAAAGAAAAAAAAHPAVAATPAAAAAAAAGAGIRAPSPAGSHAANGGAATAAGGGGGGGGQGSGGAGPNRAALVAAAAAVDPVMMSKYAEQQILRSTVALSAVLSADHTGVLGRPDTDRGVGAHAVSRWYRADGTFEWLPCVITAVSDNGTAFAIEWDHNREYWQASARAGTVAIVSQRALGKRHGVFSYQNDGARACPRHSPPLSVPPPHRQDQDRVPLQHPV